LSFVLNRTCSCWNSDRPIYGMTPTHFHEDHAGSAAEVGDRGEVNGMAHRREAPVIRGDVAGPPPNFADWNSTCIAASARTSCRPRRPPGSIANRRTVISSGSVGARV
jgi:glyoxylase-like metal-dependent hydrolase (beta-lactamase superfamily II)